MTVRPLPAAPAALAATIILCAPCASPAADGSPPAPAADKFDWIQLDTDEWLKGKIEVMYQDSLEFDSEKLDDLQFDWSDVKQIRSAQILQVRATGNRVAVGRVVLEDGEVRVLGDAESRFSRDEIISVTAGVPRELNYWAARVTLGATAREGNTNQIEASTSLSLQRRTIENRMSLDYVANYTRSESVETANNQRVNLSWDHFVTDRFFLRPLTGEYYRDPFQNLAHQISAGTGVGYQVLDTAKTGWEVFAGPGYRVIEYDDVEPGEDSTERSWLFFAGTNFDRELSDWIDLTYEYEFQITSESAGLYTHHMVGGLDIELTHKLDLTLSVTWDRTEKPQPDSDGMVPKKNDWRYVVGLGWNF